MVRDNLTAGPDCSLISHARSLPDSMSTARPTIFTKSLVGVPSIESLYQTNLTNAEELMRGRDAVHKERPELLQQQQQHARGRRQLMVWLGACGRRTTTCNHGNTPRISVSTLTFMQPLASLPYQGRDGVRGYMGYLTDEVRRV